MSDANFVGYPITIAVEFVLQLVDFDQPGFRIAGWAIAGLLVGSVLLLIVRRQRDGSSPPAALELALELGREMLKFLHMRDSAIPPPIQSPWPAFSLLGGRSWGSGRAWRRGHDAETMSLWSGRFAKKLSATLAKLHDVDLIDQAEAKSLLGPTTPDEARAVAVRLIDLGCRQV